MSQRALPKESQRYMPHKRQEQDRNGLHFMTVVSLRLGTGNESPSKVGLTNSVAPKTALPAMHVRKG